MNVIKTMKNAFEQVNETLFISGFADEMTSDFEQQLIHCQNLGIRYLSLRGVNGKNIGDITFEEAQNQILPLLQTYDIKVSSIGSPIGKIALHDEAAFAKQLAMLKELCAIANLLSCRYIRIFSFYPEEGSNFDEAKDEVIAKLKQFVAIAESAGIILIHENEKDIYGDIARRCKTLFSEIISPNFKAVFDPANFVQMGEDAYECFDLLEDDIVYIHIKDACYADEQNVVCGSGDGKITDILRKAVEDGYEGFLTLEPHLVIFDSLKDLELKDVHDIIKEDKGLDPVEAYDMQYTALLNILKTIGGQYEKN